MTTLPEGPLSELADRLRALGAEPSARELAEALWLACHVGRARTHEDGPQTHGPDKEPDDGLAPPPHAPSPRHPAPAPGEQQPDRGRLYADHPRPAPPETSPADAVADAGFVRVRAPMATALPHGLDLQRALRPLQRYQPPVRTPAHRLDEQATAEQAAETGLLLPVRQVTVRREARLRLLMDGSTSTGVWDTALEELRRLCAGLGAFHEVTLHYLHEGADGQLLATTVRDAARAPRAAEQLRDPTGRQLTLVFSDCAGPLWRSGRMHRLLHRWGRAAPVAVVQPLPQRMWRRTHLPALPGVLRRREGLGAHLEFMPAQDAPRPADALPVPVLAPTPAALGAWARLLSGSTGLSLPAPAAWVRPGHSASPPRAERPVADAESAVRAFRRTASRQAVHLATAFSAVPLTLPVMQLVQRAMQPRSGPTALAEVLLSGLLERTAEDGWYEFRPGVREALLRLLPRGDAMLVLKHCGVYVDRHFGRRARNFPALALARLTGAAVALPAEDDDTFVPQAFAVVSGLVLGRYEGSRAQHAQYGGSRAPRAKRERETFRVVYEGRRYKQRQWAEWITHVLASCGYEVTLLAWTHEGQYRAMVTPSPGSRRVLALLDEGTPGPLPDGVVGVQLHGRPERPEVRVEPYTWMDYTSEGVARWRLLNQLRIPRTAYAPNTPGPPFPVRAPVVGGDEMPSRPVGWADQSLLEELRRKLASQHESSAICALIGLPGVGKTQHAVEYVRRYGEEYDLVWWVGAHDVAGRRFWLADMAVELGLPVPADASARIGALHQALRGADLRCLIVFDGWNDRQDTSDLLLSGAHTVITTRDPSWADAVESVRLGPAEEAPATTREPIGPEYERMRRAMVRVDSSRGPGENLSSGCGFFLAPGWVVTSESVAAERHPLAGGTRSAVGVTTADGHRHPAVRVILVGDLALLHVPDADAPECLRLTDTLGARAGEGTLHWVEGSPDSFSVVSKKAKISQSDRSSSRGPGAIVLTGVLMPEGSAGGPVLEAADGALIGVIKSRAEGRAEGRAVPIEALRDLRHTLGDGAELWHGIVAAHDRHHWERHLAGSDGSTWTDLRTAANPAPTYLSAEERVELYALLAELPPPLADEGQPVSWRERAGQQRTVGKVLEYAAHVWADPAVSGTPARRELRAWIERTARARLDERQRRLVADVLAEADEVSVLVAVEPSPSAGQLVWRMEVVRRGRREAVSEVSFPADNLLEGAVVAHLWSVLRDNGVVEAELHSVQFALPRELLWSLPVDQWRPPGHSAGLGELCHVYVRCLAHSTPRVDLARWNGVEWGPLQPVKLTGLNSRAAHVPRLEQAPETAVPIGCHHDAGDRSSSALDAAQALGYPLILWNRAPDASTCDDFLPRATELVAGSGIVSELLDQVKDLRIRGARGDADAAWARNLGVYYDPLTPTHRPRDEGPVSEPKLGNGPSAAMP